MTDPVMPASDQRAATEPVSRIPEPLPPSSFADPSKARRTIALDNPIIVDGKTWSEIYVRRFTVDQVGVIMRNWTEDRKSNPEAQPMFPSFIDEAGTPVPQRVTRLLDFDDMQKLQKAAQDFLPLMFRTTPEQTNENLNDSGPSGGSTTDPSSSGA